MMIKPLPVVDSFINKAAALRIPYILSKIFSMKVSFFSKLYAAMVFKQRARGVYKRIEHMIMLMIIEIMKMVVMSFAIIFKMMLMRIKPILLSILLLFLTIIDHHCWPCPWNFVCLCCCLFISSSQELNMWEWPTFVDSTIHMYVQKTKLLANKKQEWTFFLDSKIHMYAQESILLET